MQQHVQEGANIVPLASGEAERIMDHREMTHLHSNKLPNEMLKSEIQLKNVNIAKGRKEAKYEYINCKCERLNEER